jgi:hypothetical protein
MSNTPHTARRHCGGSNASSGGLALALHESALGPPLERQLKHAA